MKRLSLLILLMGCAEPAAPEPCLPPDTTIMRNQIADSPIPTVTVIFQVCPATTPYPLP